MASRFNPSATNPHLLFSLRDLAAVWEGLLLMSTAQIEPVGSLLARRGLIGLKESEWQLQLHVHVHVLVGNGLIDYNSHCYLLHALCTTHYNELQNNYNTNIQ